GSPGNAVSTEFRNSLAKETFRRRLAFAGSYEIAFRHFQENARIFRQSPKRVGAFIGRSIFLYRARQMIEDYAKTWKPVQHIDELRNPVCRHLQTNRQSPFLGHPPSRIGFLVV